MVFIWIPIKGWEHLDGCGFDLILKCWDIGYLNTRRWVVGGRNEVVLHLPRLIIKNGILLTLVLSHGVQMVLVISHEVPLKKVQVSFNF